MTIPYNHQTIDQSDIDAVIEVLKGDYLTCGPMIEKFEEAFAEYVGSKYAIAVSSCTAALHLSLLAAGIGPGDEVITTPITFAATANAILYVGATPVFADIDPLTYNIDPEDIARKVTPKTRAIIPVHFAGRPCEMDRIWNIAEELDLFVIEDAAHALGATHKGQRIGGLKKTDLTCFSFHPVKHITCGEGGMITTNSKTVAMYLKEYRNHGRNKSGYQMHIGYNYRMTDMQAALGLSQLQKSDDFLRERIGVAKYYYFNGVCSYDLFPWNSSWHLYVIQVPDRDKVKQYLNEHEIGAQIHYKPVYLHPYYQGLGYGKGLCPIAEEFAEHCLSLPCYVRLGTEQQDYITRCLEDALNEV